MPMTHTSTSWTPGKRSDERLPAAAEAWQRREARGLGPALPPAAARARWLIQWTSSRTAHIGLMARQCLSRATGGHLIGWHMAQPARLMLPCSPRRTSPALH